MSDFWTGFEKRANEDEQPHFSDSELKGKARHVGAVTGALGALKGGLSGAAYGHLHGRHRGLTTAAGAAIGGVSGALAGYAGTRHQQKKHPYTKGDEKDLQTDLAARK